MLSKNLGLVFRWLKTSVWAFPIVLLLLFLILTAFKISGTSAGAYHRSLYGAEVKDPNLLYGKPRAVRSDEWLIWTQISISQSKNNFPRFNEDLGSGRDLSLGTEYPAWDWSTLFAPQNWSYFILPFEYAFAFKWWFLMYLLIVAVYFFVLRILPHEKKFAILFGIAIGLSPFVLWWYQSAAFLTLAYGFLAIILSMRIINGETSRLTSSKRLSHTLHVLALAFVIACFGLILYPPFQIPIALAVLFFVFGYLLQKKFNQNLGWKTLNQRLSLLFVSVLLAGFVGITFVATHRTPIEALEGSLYPGSRVVVGGTLNPIHFFNGSLMPILQSDRRGSQFISNQSESSNFINLFPFLLVPAVALVVRQWRMLRKVDWILLSLIILSVLLLLRAFTTFADGLFKFMLLQNVQNYRLIMGFGFLGILIAIYVVKRLQEIKIPNHKLLKLAASYGFVCFLALMIVGFYVTRNYPLFMRHLWVVAILAIMFTSIVVAFLINKRLVAVSLFLVFTLLSSFLIMPLYQGLGFLDNGVLIQRMQKISNKGDAWVTVGDKEQLYNRDIVYDGLALTAGRRSISGYKVYPDVNLWRQEVGAKYENIYNRQGHVLFVDDPGMTEPVRLIQANYFQVKFDCNGFVKRYVDFALSTHPLAYPCTQLVDKVAYPKVTFYIYKINTD